MFNVFLFMGLMFSQTIEDRTLRYVNDFYANSCILTCDMTTETVNDTIVYLPNNLKIDIDYKYTTTFIRGTNAGNGSSYSQYVEDTITIDLSFMNNDIYTFVENYGGLEMLRNEYYIYEVLSYIRFDFSPTYELSNSTKYAELNSVLDINFVLSFEIEEQELIKEYSALEVVDFTFGQLVSGSLSYANIYNSIINYNSFVYNNNNELNYLLYEIGKDLGGDTAYDNGYNVGYDLGYNQGFQTAIDSNPNNVLELITKPFLEMGKFLNISIAPNLTLGMIIAVPIVVAIIGFLIKALIA